MVLLLLAAVFVTIIVLAGPINFKLPPIYVFPWMPTPPVTIRAPVPVLVEGVKGAPMLPMMALPITFRFPPTYVFPRMPTPPVTIRAPVPVLVEGV